MKKWLMTLLIPFGLVFGAANYAYAQADAGVDASVEVAEPTAASTDVPTPDEDLGGFLQLLVDAAKQGKWLLLAGLLLLGVVEISKRLLVLLPGKAGDFFGTKLGKALLGFLAAIGGALAAASMAGQSLSVALVVGALATAWVAAGMWGHLKDLLQKVAS